MSHTGPFEGMFHDLSREHGFEPLAVEGAIPLDLKGTLYRNGPARFGSADGPYLHWFDGDGALTAVRLNGAAGPRGACRVTETRWLRAERAAGRQLYRSYAQLGRGWRRWGTLPKNPANIGVLPVGDQVLALWEAGLPIGLDPETLECRGETTLGGAIGPTFSAHPHSVGGTVFNFGVAYGPRFHLDLYTIGRDVARLARLPLPRPTLIHDFMPTGRHLVFFCPPIRLRLARLLMGISDFNDNLAWEPEHGTEVIVVPLADPTHPIRFTIPPFFQWHLVNGWEEGGEIVVDLVTYDDFETNRWFGQVPYNPPTAPPASRYVRARLDPTARTVHTEVLLDTCVEFASVHPDDAGRAHNHAWMLHFPHGDRPFPPELGRLDTRTGTFTPLPLGGDVFPSEPILVPRPGHAAPWLLSLCYHAPSRRSFVAILDGARPGDHPVARVWFDHAIPHTFHGAWAPA